MPSGVAGPGPHTFDHLSAASFGPESEPTPTANSIGRRVNSLAQYGRVHPFASARGPDATGAGATPYTAFRPRDPATSVAAVSGPAEGRTRGDDLPYLVEAATCSERWLAARARYRFKSRLWTFPAGGSAQRVAALCQKTTASSRPTIGPGRAPRPPQTWMTNLGHRPNRPTNRPWCRSPRQLYRPQKRAE